MDHYELAQQTMVENGLLKYLTDALRDALAWRVQGDDFSRKLSTLQFISKSLQRHLARLMNLEEVDGYMDIVLESKPSLSKSVRALKHEHEDFREGTQRIVHRLDLVARGDHGTFTDVCDELADFLDRLDEHAMNEAKLFQEALEQEEGGEG
jgi:hypothetical protein